MSEPAGVDSSEQIDGLTLWGKAVPATLLMLAIGVYGVAAGSLAGAMFLALGISYVLFIAGALMNRPKVVTIGFALVGGVMLVIALVAVVNGRRDYALAIGAYGVWALVTGWSRRIPQGERSFILLIAGHGLALIGFILVSLSFPWNVPAPVLAIAFSLANVISVRADQRD